MLFVYERCISTRLNRFSTVWGWRGTPAVHALCWTPFQREDFSSSHCNTFRGAVKPKSLSFSASLSVSPLCLAAVKHIKQPELMSAHCKGNNITDKARWLIFTEKSVIIILKGPGNIDLTALFRCSLFSPWKTAGLCLGRWTGVGWCSLGMKSTLPYTEVHVYLWALLDVDVGRVRDPLV